MVDKTYTELNIGEDGNVMDEVLVTYPDPPTGRHRPLIVLSGSGIDDVVEAPITSPVGDEPGIINRPIHSPYPGTPICELQSVTLVASSSETTVAEYTVGASTTFYFLGFMATGDIDAEFTVYVESDGKLNGRTSVAWPVCQVNFPYAVFTVAEGDTIRLKVTHYKTGLQGEFKGTIIGYIL